MNLRRSAHDVMAGNYLSMEYIFFNPQPVEERGFSFNFYLVFT